MSQITIASIEADIAKRKKELVELEQTLTKAKLESPDKQLAKELHGMLCRWNHTDGCGWFYEMKNNEDDWTGHAHGEYLGRAQKLTHICESDGIAVERAFEMFKLIRGI